jgi:putrescine transport system permease protein
MVIFSKIKLGVTPDVNALATLIIGTVSIGIVIASWMMFRQAKRNSVIND